MYFAYGETECSYLRQKDKRLCAVIDRIGHIERAVDTDLFSSVVHHIIGQQISTKAQATIWCRCQDTLGEVNAEAILTAGVPKLQSLGMTFRKAEYITDFAEKVHTGVFSLDAVAHMDDEDAIRALSSLKGIGVWTAEMILLFCLQRPDIFSYDDLAIQRGLRMVYHHREIDRRLFEKYRRRFHPYCSVASLYLWAVAGGAIPEMKDYKPKSKSGKSKRGTEWFTRRNMLLRSARSRWPVTKKQSLACGSTGSDILGISCRSEPSRKSDRCSQMRNAGWTYIFLDGSRIFCRCCGMTPRRSAKRSARLC